MYFLYLDIFVECFITFSYILFSSLYRLQVRAYNDHYDDDTGADDEFLEEAEPPVKERRPSVKGNKRPLSMKEEKAKERKAAKKRKKVKILKLHLKRAVQYSYFFMYTLLS